MEEVMSDGTERGANGFLRQVLAWWRLLASQESEFAALDSAEIEHIARDFGLSRHELVTLSQKGAGGAELLHAMMRANQLSFERLREAYPDVARDLEIHCSLCREKRRCRREIDSGAAPRRFEDFCPNASTFVELQAETSLRLG
jgi:hypothetical protein